ncbi:MAG: thiamine pyrophosphate-binding protein [Dehalococcoidia bacterium]|nr:thiamine pyrophosphate-binding protein [Dehalococcoidia bacterium]
MAQFDQRPTGAEVIGRVLKEEGVDYAFGIGGGGSIQMMWAASQYGIRIVHMRHEQGASFAADAYARYAHKPAAVFLFAGPGATNAANGIAQAYFSRSPMVVFVGQQLTLEDQRGASAASYAAQMMKPYTKGAMQVMDDRLLAFYTKRALQEAMSFPPGPVLLDVPQNYLIRRRPFREQRGYTENFLRRPLSGGGGDPASIEAAVKLLLTAERPVLVAGEEVGWFETGAQLQELSELLNCPVITRRTARGAVPETHPLSFYGRVRGPLLRKADMAMTIGLRLDFLEGYGDWGRNARFIQICHSENDLEFDVSTELGITGNTKAILKQMVECARSLVKTPPPRREWLETLNSTKEADDRRLAEVLERTAHETPIHPAYLAHEILTFLDDDATVVSDSFTGSHYLTERLRAKIPGQMIDTGEWITVGHGIAMGVGAQLARPGKQVLINMGDGGLGIGGFDIETAARCNLPVCYLINNNNTWMTGQVDMFYGDSFVLPDGKMGDIFKVTPNVRYDKMFEVFGCHAEHVEHPEDIRPALQRSFASGKTSVVNVMVNPKVYQPGMYQDGPRWMDPLKMPEAGRRVTFPELYRDKE